jgi:predicted esterase
MDQGSVVARLPLLLLLAGCGCAGVERVGSSSPESATAPAAHSQRSPDFLDLPVPGFESAVVSVPKVGPTRRPLLVAAHGAWDRPEPHCALWQRVVGDRAFILCLRGQPTVRDSTAAYYYPDHFALAREARAAISALAARYPQQLDPSAAVLAGFSQGAIHGALVIVLHPEVFPRAVLIEGGNGFFDEWSPFAARRFAQAGGERVLFGCGSPSCVRTASRCADYLERHGVETQVVHAKGAGHSYGTVMEASLSETFDWVVASDSRWSP